MEDTIIHRENRYELGLLWTTDDPQLPDNYPYALKRFQALERRLARDPELARKYSSVINEYLSMGHARKLSAAEVDNLTPGRVWFNPHHPVVNPHKPGKCRVVFDLSAVCDGVSLNSRLLKGPDLLADLAGTLLRFREKRVAVVADIQRMFHQVRVRSSDASALCFLWKNPGDREPPQIHQMLVQVFGATCSPTICAFALRRAAQESADSRIIREVERHFYVDNWLSSFDDEEDAISTAKALTVSLSKGGFPLTQWSSSSPRLLFEVAPPEGQSTAVNMDLENLVIERTLGLSWIPKLDAFQLVVTFPTEDVKTKRQLLKTLASIYDPLGFLCPVLLQAKLILREVWRSSTEWDEPPPTTLLKSWIEWQDGLRNLQTLTIPRQFKTPATGPEWQLHLFSDASEEGYGAVAYLRASSGSCAEVSFVMSKSRVAPLKYVSIPRLELCGAVLAVRLAQYLRREMDLTLRDIYFWTDSTCVLCWLNRPERRYQVFVANRLAEILESSSADQWRHIPGAENPADDVSRGLPASQLIDSHRWFTGPAFLSKSTTAWPDRRHSSTGQEEEELHPF